jgi:hypothetical protein
MVLSTNLFLLHLHRDPEAAQYIGCFTPLLAAALVFGIERRMGYLLLPLKR